MLICSFKLHRHSHALGEMGSPYLELESLLLQEQVVTSVLVALSSKSSGEEICSMILVYFLHHVPQGKLLPPLQTKWVQTVLWAKL